jgi:uncharacterized protein YvpB
MLKNISGKFKWLSAVAVAAAVVLVVVFIVVHGRGNDDNVETYVDVKDTDGAVETARETEKSTESAASFETEGNTDVTEESSEDMAEQSGNTANNEENEQTEDTDTQGEGVGEEAENAQEGGSHVISGVTCIMQEPELPSGCEITSLTILLNYLGYRADKIVMAQDYLITSPLESKSLYEAFGGDPADPAAYGCYAPVIVNSANQYLKDSQSNKTAYDISGTEFEDLFTYIDSDIPVVVWTTEDLAAPQYTKEWYTDDGVYCTWISPQHCVLLYGYDKASDMVYISDPLKGNVTYSLETFALRYRQMSSQAVVIK